MFRPAHRSAASSSHGALAGQGSVTVSTAIARIKATLLAPTFVSTRRILTIFNGSGVDRSTVYLLRPEVEHLPFRMIPCILLLFVGTHRGKSPSHATEKATFLPRRKDRGMPYLTVRE